MLTKDDLRRLLDYDDWANHRVLRAVAALTPEQWKRDLGGSHGGVRGTLAHILGAAWIWLERWKGVSPPRLPDEGEFADVMALRERWRVVEEHRRAWFDGLRPEQLGEPVRYKSTEGKPYEAPLWQLVQHLVNHSTYHRGQVSMQLRLLGAKPTGTDLLTWDREQASR